MNLLTLRVLYKAITDSWNVRDKRTSYVISGLTPTATGAGSLGISVATGTLVVNGTYVSYTAGSAGTASTADPTNPRVDSIRFASGATTPSIVTGTAAVNPVAPAIGANDLLIGVAFIPAGATDFTAAGAYVEDVTPLRNDITTTLGDTIVADTNGVAQRLAIGAAGRIASVVAGTLSWGQGPLTTDGDLLVGATAGTPTRLAKGTALQQLRVNAGATALEYATIAGASGGTPAVVLGTTNAAGVATTFVRDDDTILVFDTTVPAAVGTAAVGTATTVGRRDHVHPTGAGTPSTQAFGDAAATGTGPAAAMTDHKHAMPASPIVLISETIVTGSVAATIDFTSIPATYKHLWFIGTLQTDTGAGFVRVQFNGDTAANYDSEYQRGSAAANSAAATTGVAQIDIGIADNLNGNPFEAKIPSYARTTLKKGILATSGNITGTNQVQQNWGRWNSTAAITRVTFFLSAGGGNFAIGSTLGMYGLP